MLELKPLSCYSPGEFSFMKCFALQRAWAELPASLNRAPVDKAAYKKSIPQPCSGTALYRQRLLCRAVAMLVLVIVLLVWRM